MNQALCMWGCFLIHMGFGILPVTYAQEQRLPSVAELRESMHGEDVLPADQASLLAPLARMKGQPWFEVSNVRPGSTLSIALEFDYACAGEAQGQLHAVVVTNGRKHRFPISSTEFTRRRGEISCSYSAISDKQPFGRNVEVYIEMTNADPASYSSRYRQAKPAVSNPLYFKVSASVLRGENTNKTLSRAMRQDEFELYVKRRKKYGPPPPAPPGYMKPQKYWPIVAGAPALVAYQGEWLQGEILEFRADGKLTVDVPSLKQSALMAMTLDAVALSSATIKALKDSPQQFSPSTVIVPGSLRRPPPGYVLVPDDLVIPRGLPLDYHGSEVLFVAQVGSTVTVLNSRAFTQQSVSRDQLLVSQAVLRSIDNAASLASYESRLDVGLKRGEDKYARRLPLDARVRSYPIKIALPDGYERVTIDTLLEVGDIVMVSYSSKWSRVTVKGLRESDRAVEIFWPDWRSNYFVSRDSLIVATSDTKERSGVLKPFQRIIPDDESEQAQGDGADSKATDDSAGSEGSGGHSNPEKPRGAGGNYKLVLNNAGPKSILAIKLVMEISDVDLAIAAAAVKALPMELKRGLSQEAAERWSQRFTDAGADTQVLRVPNNP